MANAGSDVSAGAWRDEIQARELGERLGPRRERRPDADVAGPVEHRLAHLLERVRADADQRVRPEDARARP